MMQKLILSFILILAFTGCARRSLDDFKDEGESVTRSLIQELSKIRNRRQLLTASPKLQRLFNQLTDVMIAAQEFRQKFPDANKDIIFSNNELSDQLRLELNRIYKIEGGRQIIEKCQEQSLYRLDAYEKRMK